MSNLENTKESNPVFSDANPISCFLDYFDNVYSLIRTKDSWSKENKTYNPHFQSLVDLLRSNSTTVDPHFCTSLNSIVKQILYLVHCSSSFWSLEGIVWWTAGGRGKDSVFVSVQLHCVGNVVEERSRDGSIDVWISTAKTSTSCEICVYIETTNMDTFFQRTNSLASKYVSILFSPFSLDMKWVLSMISSKTILLVSFHPLFNG